MDRASASEAEDLGSSPNESTILSQNKKSQLLNWLFCLKMVEVAGVEPACPVPSYTTSTCLADFQFSPRPHEKAREAWLLP